MRVVSLVDSLRWVDKDGAHEADGLRGVEIDLPEAEVERLLAADAVAKPARAQRREEKDAAAS